MENWQIKMEISKEYKDALEKVIENFLTDNCITFTKLKVVKKKDYKIRIGSSYKTTDI